MRNNILIATATGLMLLGGSALASDHLFNAATAPGNDERGFNNPVAQNPSGVSGPKAQPATVPGEGNPNAGQDRGTPSVNPALLNCHVQLEGVIPCPLSEE
ncbi:MAG: hypothetical protein OEU94_08450 [Aquincola sp.]|nr:hypothetical protein [Aquincola sp.]